MTEIRCSRCNAPNRDTARFCAECGEPLLAGLPAKANAAADPAAARRSAGPVAGAVLEGRYRIEVELGRGGFGAVFKALDLRLNKTVAVKENLESSPEAQRQFAREASVLANLSHPSLPRVIDHFSIPEQGQYLVMDFIDGEDLNSLVERQGRIPPIQAVTWIDQVAEALVYLHGQKPPVVHRDIKPANIRITQPGKAVLVDFGLVKLSDANVKTTQGARAITPGYAPPEQYGVGYTDARTDIYALGATLYRALTGCEPVESVQRMTGQALPPAMTVNPQVPAALNRAVEQALALEPNRRYQNAADFHAALRACLIELKAQGAGEPARHAGIPPTAVIRGSDSQPQRAAPFAPEPAPGSRPRPAPPPDYVAVARSGTAAVPYAAAPAVQPRVSKPASQPPRASRPISKPLQTGTKWAFGTGVALLTALIVVGAAVGGYVFYRNNQQAGLQMTATGQSLGTALAQVQNTSAAMTQVMGTATQVRIHAEATATAQARIDGEATGTALAALPGGKMAITGVYQVGSLGFERILLKNTSSGKINLSGWTIKNGRGNSYVFGQSIVPPTGEIILYTGSGSSIGTVLHWGMDQPVWTYGDQITLTDDQGKAQAVFIVTR